jgi:hypothetical protein
MALVQAIVYSEATGRVRRVLDPGRHIRPARFAELLATVRPQLGERALIYAKQLGGADTLHAWQREASLACGRLPDPVHPVTLAVVEEAAAARGIALRRVKDRYVAVDPAGRVRAVHYADPLIDHVAGCRLLQHDRADESWMLLRGQLLPIAIAAITPLALAA